MIIVSLLLGAAVLSYPGPSRVGRAPSTLSPPSARSTGSAASAASAASVLRHRAPGEGPRRGGVLPVAAALAGIAGCLQLAPPWDWLLSPVAGLLGWRIAKLAASRDSSARPESRYVALTLDLIAGALSAGLPPDLAIEVVGNAAVAAGSSDLMTAVAPLTRVGMLLRWGADPEQAWRALDEPGLHRVAVAGRRCAHSGAQLAGSLRAAAVELRADSHRRCLDRAGRAGVWALLPLGLCFLPAFVCLGVAPVLIGMAGTVLGH